MTLRIPLLLTSAGITNTSLRGALVELLGKPIEESTALAIPTASYGHPYVSPHQAWKFLAGVEYRTPMVELGWKSVGILELTSLPTIGDDRWKEWVRDADALLVNGGEPAYLTYWMRESGFADLLPTLEKTVYVGLSAGTVVMSPRFGADFVGWHSPLGAGDAGLGHIDFAMFPHVDNPDLPENTMADAEKWAATLSSACYAIDDSTGISLVDGKLDVISEGHWKLLHGAA